jgi:hypothetical protein
MGMLICLRRCIEILHQIQQRITEKEGENDVQDKGFSSG